jgi:hypothetical protein
VLLLGSLNKPAHMIAERASFPFAGGKESGENVMRKPNGQRVNDEMGYFI